MEAILTPTRVHKFRENTEDHRPTCCFSDTPNGEFHGSGLYLTDPAGQER
jgi:hypothetical protein